MDGVTILNTYMTYSDGWVAILSVGIISCVFLFIACVYQIGEGEIVTGVLLGILVLFIVIGCVYIPKTTYYEAVLEPSVSWKQLVDKYYVVKIKGQIITLVERQGE